MIILACLLTVLIETGFLALFGFRSRFDLTVIVCANIITNLVLNTVITLFFHGYPGGWIWVMEALVVAAEFGIYAFAFKPSWKLFFLTFAANALSYSIGLILF